jgi:hypothetical protein
VSGFIPLHSQSKNGAASPVTKTVHSLTPATIEESRRAHLQQAILPMAVQQQKIHARHSRSSTRAAAALTSSTSIPTAVLTSSAYVPTAASMPSVSGLSPVATSSTTGGPSRASAGPCEAERKNGDTRRRGKKWTSSSPTVADPKDQIGLKIGMPVEDSLVVFPNGLSRAPSDGDHLGEDGGCRRRLSSARLNFFK